MITMKSVCDVITARALLVHQVSVCDVITFAWACGGTFECVFIVYLAILHSCIDVHNVALMFIMVH